VKQPSSTSANDLLGNLREEADKRRQEEANRLRLNAWKATSRLKVHIRSPKCSAVWSGSRYTSGLCTHYGNPRASIHNSFITHAVDQTLCEEGVLLSHYSLHMLCTRHCAKKEFYSAITHYTCCGPDIVRRRSSTQPLLITHAVYQTLCEEGVLLSHYSLHMLCTRHCAKKEFYSAITHYTCCVPDIVRSKNSTPGKSL
jgi:hypothetical protein